MSREYDAMLRLEEEELMPIKRARTLFIGTPSVRTIQRYINFGVYSPVTLKRVYLEAFRGPGRSWWTSRQAVRRFVTQFVGGSFDG